MTRHLLKHGEMTNEQLIREMQKTDAIVAVAVKAMQTLLKHEDKSNSSEFNWLSESIKDFLEDHDYEVPHRCWACGKMVDSNTPRHEGGI